MNLQICTTAGEDLLLRDVSTYLVDREVLHVLYCSGDKHNYPLQNIRWFGEIIETPTSKTFVGFAQPNDESLLSQFCIDNNVRPATDEEYHFGRGPFVPVGPNHDPGPRVSNHVCS